MITRPSQKAREVTGDEARQDVQRRAALTRARDDLAHVLGLGRGEDLDHLGDDGARQRAAGDDGGQLPPEGAVAERRDHQVRRMYVSGHRDDRGEPHELGEGLLEVHLVGVAVLRPFASMSLM
jgi:hypothetical protein